MPRQEILSLVYARTGHSFSAYKVSTTRRRLERRLNLHQIDRPEHYLRYSREHPDERDNLRHVATMHQTKSGEVMRVFIHVSPLTNDQGTITGFVTIAIPGVAPEDVTMS
jgi:chemotaxis methyl-accepting protein methylase